MIYKLSNARHVINAVNLVITLSSFQLTIGVAKHKVII